MPQQLLLLAAPSMYVSLRHASVACLDVRPMKRVAWESVGDSVRGHIDVRIHARSGSRMQERPIRIISGPSIQELFVPATESDSERE